MIQLSGGCAINSVQHYPLAQSFVSSQTAPAAGVENAVPATNQPFVPSGWSGRPLGYWQNICGGLIPGNSYPGVPCVMQGRNNAGLFFPSYGSDVVPTAASKIRYCMTQLMSNDDNAAADWKFGPLAQSLIKARMGFSSNLPAIAVGAWADVTVAATTPYVLTAISLERRDGTSTWWPPVAGLNPNDTAIPFPVGNMRIACFNPFNTNGSTNVAAAYALNLFGFDPGLLPVPLKTYEVQSGALAASDYGARNAYSLISYETSCWFQMIGAILIGRNTGNYYMIPWAFIARDTTGWNSPEGRGSVIFANARSAGQARAHNAGDFAVRLIGVEIPPEVYNTPPDGYSLLDSYTDPYTTTQHHTSQWGITLTHWADASARAFSNPDGEGGEIRIWKKGNDYIIRGGVYCLDYVFRSIRMHITDKAALLAKLGGGTKIQLNRFHSWISTMPANTGAITRYDTVMDRTDWPSQTALTGANLANVIESCYWNTNTSNPGFRNARMHMIEASVTVS